MVMLVRAVMLPLVMLVAAAGDGGGVDDGV